MKMPEQNTQVRMVNNTLYGYRGILDGKRVLAIMKESKNGSLILKDYIFLDELYKDLNSEPCLMLEKFM